jgi:hypothetical protein
LRLVTSRAASCTLREDLSSGASDDAVAAVSGGAELFEMSW